ncbi:DUF3251 domain-containing protein [Rhizorhabdus phycosphaerae]|uniref:DUF3251 domain-containing protein n=1 Tax=Rhizorhabdus phycosphaerae TaxID=2711156 RepID=UPI0013EB300F|nr:DUF3251 domain-containing protein [Rhizorhabdus phycosphaerae]
MRRSLLCAMLALPLLTACGSKTDTRLKALEDRLAKVEAAVETGKAVSLKPGAAGYGILQSDMGRIAVAIAKVETYAGGTRVTLDFGNPTAARLSGMKAKIEWGAIDGKGLPVVNANQSTSFTAPEPLPAGSWKQYVIDLPGVQPTQLGFIRISGFESGNVDLLSS